MDNPRYEATIPGRYASVHRSEAAAIRAIRKAEKTIRLNGTVTRVDRGFDNTVYGYFDVGCVTTQ